MNGELRRDRLTPDQFRVAVSAVLRVGVTTAAALTGAGFAMSLLVGWEGSLLGLPPTTSSPTDFSQLMSGIVALRPVAVAQPGCSSCSPRPSSASRPPSSASGWRATGCTW